MGQSGTNDKFSHHARAVAEELYGEPNKQLSSKSEMRFGKQGSVSVDLKTGQFYDHEAKEGGGVLWAIEHVAGATVAGGKAVEWMRDRGFDVEDSNRPASPSGGSSGGARLDLHGNYLPNRVPDNGELTATYDYTTPKGELSYQVCRYDWSVPVEQNPKGREKTFVQRRPDETKAHGWTYSTKGMTWLPYRLPELLEDVASGYPIFVVEGEKKVDMLREAGVPATCNHGGAGKFPESLVEHFAGAEVIILPDNDDAGRDHADLVGRRLEGTAKKVRTLMLPDLPPKGGVDDWLPAGGSADALYDLVDAAASTFEAKPFESKFGAVRWLDFDAPGPTYEHIIKDVLTKGELAMLLGESQSGKSFLAIDIAMAVARGIEWFGHKTKRGGVIYQAGESAVGVRRRRFPAYRQKFDVAGEDLPVVLLERPVDFYNSEDQVDEFIEECRHWDKVFDTPLELIVIDTFNKATPGANENDGKDMGTVLARCDRIRAETGATVMLVHHLNARGTKARGHTSLFANVENVITVRKVEGAADHDNRKIREWVISKQKDGVDGVKNRFVLPAVQIGTDADGDRITSCIVARPSGAGDDAQSSKGITLSGMNAVILRAFYSAIDKKGEPAPSEIGLHRGALAVQRATLQEHIRASLVVPDEPNEIKPGETPEKALEREATARRKAIQRAREHLYSKGVIGFQKIGDEDNPQEWFWLTGKDVKGFGPAPGQRRRSKGDEPPTEAEKKEVDLPFDMDDFDP